jgi:hypothetical protein
VKVYINNYKNHWVSPYTIIDRVFFWKDWSKCSRWPLEKTLEDDARKLKGEKSLYIERPDWVEIWADRLTPISKAIQWVWDKVDHKINYVKIDKWDTWSMDHTLSYIILPMLKQLKANTHGAPNVVDEDVPDGLKSTSAPPKENEYDVDDNHFKRWEYVLDEMIFAFEHKVDDSWEQEFCSGEHDVKSVPCEWDENGKPTMYKFERGPNDTYQCDYDGMAKVHDRIENGFRLFGKYYSGLWD